MGIPLVKSAELNSTAAALATLLGVSAGATNLGTLAGTTISDNLSIKQVLEALETVVQNKSATLGVAVNATHLGTFTGVTISDSATVKAALQEIETRLEAVDLDTDDMAALVGLAENVQNLGTFTGGTIADSQTVKQALQALETLIEATIASTSAADAANEVHIDNSVTLSGVVKDSTSLGTFTGSTIADSSTIKAALQSLETTLEAVDLDTDDMAALVGLAENVH